MNTINCIVNNKHFKHYSLLLPSTDITNQDKVLIKRIIKR